MSVGTRTHVNPSIRWNLSGEGGVLLDLSQGKYYNLNGIGSLVWQQLMAGASLEDIVKDLHDRYGSPTGQVTRDVRAFLTSLLSKGIISHVE